MLVKGAFDGFVADINLPEGCNIDFDMCDQTESDQEMEGHVDLNDEIFGVDTNKARYFNDGRRSLVFKDDAIRKVQESGTFAEIPADMEPVSADGGVKKLIRRQGNGVKPRPGVQVWVHTIWFAEGQKEPFDSTKERRRLDTFKLNGEMLPCLELAVRSMEFKEVAMFVSEPRYAYGPLGCPPRIPAGARVLFIVELIDMQFSLELPIFMRSASERQKMPLETIIDEADRLREVGNKKLAAEDFIGAEKCYEISVKIVHEYAPYSAQERAKKNQVIYKGLANLAQCYLENQDYEAIGPLVEKAHALRIIMPDAKLLFRYAKALVGLDEHEKALPVLKEALESEPDNPEILSLLDEVKKKKEEDDKAETELSKKMMSDYVTAPETQEQKSDEETQPSTASELKPVAAEEQAGFFGQIFNRQLFANLFRGNFGRV